MDYRRKKQTIIASILGLVFISLLSGAYFKWFYVGATCFDGKQNQNEEGLDCGGPCAMSCELLTVKPLQVEWSKAIFLKDGLYDLAAKINNINPNYGLGRFDYTFKLYDKAGQLLMEKKGSSFSLPNQKKYIVETNIASVVAPAKVELIVQPSEKTDWQKLTNDFATPDIFVQDKQFKYLENKAGESQASGIIKNNSVFDLDKIIVSVVLFNESKEVIGVNKTEVYTVPAGQERYFSVSWYSALSGEVKSADMLADTNLFADDNYMRRYGTVEKFQEY
ncbi:MAG TPA: hypothetical protein P5089_02240 [Candidatus Portnoybacteria bacterium]|nr:hypothetical protein [Candidatus Portnoybacteria bacterium]